MSGHRRIAASACGLGLFLLAVSVEPFLEPSYDPLRQEISEFAHTNLGAVALAGFLAWGFSLGLLADLVARAPLPPRSGLAARIESVALVGAAFSLILVTVFATDRGVEVAGVVTHRTVSGRIHDLGSGFVTASILVAVIADAFRERRGSVSAVVISAAVISSVVFFALGDPLPGLRQRCLVAWACLWQAVTLCRFWKWFPTSDRSSAGSRCSTS
ncbi:MAG: DUF998 domain-containing protein [Solirubrobacterales bacterium]